MHIWQQLQHIVLWTSRKTSFPNAIGRERERARGTREHCRYLLINRHWLFIALNMVDGMAYGQKLIRINIYRECVWLTACRHKSIGYNAFEWMNMIAIQWRNFSLLHSSLCFVFRLSFCFPFTLSFSVVLETLIPPHTHTSSFDSTHSLSTYLELDADSVWYITCLFTEHGSSPSALPHTEPNLMYNTSRFVSQHILIFYCCNRTGSIPLQRIVFFAQTE